MTMRMAIGRAGAILVAVGLAAIIAMPALANAAPPPYLMELRITYAGAPQAIDAVDLRHCSDAACTQSSPLSDAAIYGQGERITCTGDRCQAWVDPWLSPYLVLTMRSGGAELRSNTFDFGAHMVVEVRQSDLDVRADKIGLMDWFWSALVLTLLIELAVGAGYVILRRRALGARGATLVLLTIAVADLVSLPVVWFVIPGLGITGPVGYALVELFAWLFEAFALRLVNRRTVSTRDALLLSLVMNAASAGIFLALVAAASAACTGVRCDPLPLPW